MNNVDYNINKFNNISEWIKYNINTCGAKDFYDYLNNDWDYISNSIKDAILNEVYQKIKPEYIETIEDLAKLLDGNEYRDELYNEYDINIIDICKKNKWVIVYGASDDLIEFNGIINDEDGAWEGTIMKFVKPGDFYKEYEEEDVYHKAKDYMFVAIEDKELKEIKSSINNWKDYKGTPIIEMLWCPAGTDMSWQVNVKGAPVAKFNVMEDDEIYCEAAIIDLSKFYN